MKFIFLFFEEEDEEIFLKVQRLIQAAVITDEFHVSTHQFVSKTLEIQTDQRRVFCQGREVFLTITVVSHHVQAIRRKLKLKEEAAICLRCVREVGYSLRME